MVDFGLEEEVKKIGDRERVCTEIIPYMNSIGLDLAESLSSLQGSLSAVTRK